VSQRLPAKAAARLVAAIPGGFAVIGVYSWQLSFHAGHEPYLHELMGLML
jgi:hypothetical protein